MTGFGTHRSELKSVEKYKAQDLGPNHCLGCGKQSLTAGREDAKVLVDDKLRLGHWIFSKVFMTSAAASLKGTVSVDIKVCDNLALSC